ncbi:MAG TPA: glycogen/starch synthase [Bacteroidia bacterium]|jgi:starch synthase|nr:glycogen/starch synthase [Bacteroidia bacterium]HRG51393.1 glycogen/starch synthase [Bacteroidia bacterium]
MKKKARVLFVSQEVTPYLDETPMSIIGRKLPQGIQERGKEIRTFMPKFGVINERRNQLHEVIRLSGMNLIIDNNDHPLIIKVASIQSARMQVYFIDNQEYFERKHILTDKKGVHFADNDERAIFFCRGVIETVKKLGWSPDIVHLHGWMTSLTALYLKKSFKDNPLFSDTKIVYSVYDDEFANPLHKDFAKKVIHEGIDKSDVELYKNPTFVNVSKLAIDLSDGVIKGSPKINPEIEKYLKKSGKPVLEYKNEDEYIDAYSDFYDAVLEEVAEMID